MACFALRACLLLGVFILHNLQDTNAYPKLIDSYNQDPESDVPTCFPYEVFQIDCNTCRCGPDGMTAACTRIACIQEEILEDPMQYVDDNIQSVNIRRKREIVQSPKTKNEHRIKRGLGDYDDPNQQFYNYDEPISKQERQALVRQSRLQQRQMAEDKRREKIELAAQQQELAQHSDDMQTQLDYQKALDDLQRQYDDAQQDIDSQQWEMDRKQAIYDRQQQDGTQKKSSMDSRKKGYY